MVTSRNIFFLFCIGCLSFHFACSQAKSSAVKADERKCTDQFGKSGIENKDLFRPTYPDEASVLYQNLRQCSGDLPASIVALGELKVEYSVGILHSFLRLPNRCSDNPTNGWIRESELLNSLIAIGTSQSLGLAENYVLELEDRQKAAILFSSIALHFVDSSEEFFYMRYLNIIDVHKRAIIIRAMGYSVDSRTINNLIRIAQTDKSAFLTREAIISLNMSDNVHASVGLNRLLQFTFSESLDTSLGWRTPPKDINIYFHDFIRELIASKEHSAKARHPR